VTLKALQKSVQLCGGSLRERRESAQQNSSAEASPKVLLQSSTEVGEAGQTLNMVSQPGREELELAAGGRCLPAATPCCSHCWSQGSSELPALLQGESSQSGIC